MDAGAAPPDDDATCMVCGSGDHDDGNAILFCDGAQCSVVVHQQCYGVSPIPDGEWLCATCAANLRNKDVKCVLCPTPGGAFKQCVDATNTPTGEWAHVLCATWIPETHFGDAAVAEPICGLQDIPKSRFALKCSVCGLSGRANGACVQCQHGKCLVAFHPGCLEKDPKLFTTVLPRSDSPDNDDFFFAAFCAAHADAARERANLLEAQYAAGLASPSKRQRESKAGRKAPTMKIDGAPAVAAAAAAPASAPPAPVAAPPAVVAPTVPPSAVPPPPLPPAPPVVPEVSAGAGAGVDAPFEQPAVPPLATQPYGATPQPAGAGVDVDPKGRPLTYTKATYHPRAEDVPLLDCRKSSPPKSMDVITDEFWTSVGTYYGASPEGPLEALRWLRSGEFLRGLAPTLAPLAQIEPKARRRRAPLPTLSPSGGRLCGCPGSRGRHRSTCHMSLMPKPPPGSKHIDSSSDEEVVPAGVPQPPPEVAATWSRALVPLADGSARPFLGPIPEPPPPCPSPAPPPSPAPAPAPALPAVAASALSTAAPPAAPSAPPPTAASPPLSSGPVAPPATPAQPPLAAAPPPAPVFPEITDWHAPYPPPLAVPATYTGDDLYDEILDLTDDLEQRAVENNVALAKFAAERLPPGIEPPPPSLQEWEDTLEVQYRRMVCWKAVSAALTRGIRDQVEGFNKHRVEAVPASWKISAPGRPGAVDAEEVPPEVATEDDAVCQVCFDGESTEHNPIVFCDNCNIALHQRCYGIKEIPEGDFFCDRCMYYENTPQYSEVQCCLCPVREGAFRRTTDRRWVHLVCALWHPGVVIRDLEHMGPVDVTSRDPRAVHRDGPASVQELLALARREPLPPALPGGIVPASSAPCAQCGLAAGRTIQCSHRGCNKRFHPLCAWYAGHYMHVSLDADSCLVYNAHSGPANSTFVLLCGKHSPAGRSEEDQRAIRRKYRSVQRHPADALRQAQRKPMKRAAKADAGKPAAPKPAGRPQARHSHLTPAARDVSAIVRGMPVDAHRPNVCAVCFDASGDTESLLKCTSCSTCVHQACHGLQRVPDPAKFRCDRCTYLASPAAAKKNATDVVCSLCPRRGGILKRTLHGGWVHLFCALMIPGVSFEDPDHMSGINLAQIVPERFDNLKCCMCEFPVHGACLQCEDCFKAFHPTCAQQANCYHTWKTDDAGHVLGIAYCTKHHPPGMVFDTHRKVWLRGLVAPNELPAPMRHMLQLRRELETARLLCDRVQKREKLKRRRLTIQESLFLQRRVDYGDPLATAEGLAAQEQAQCSPVVARFKVVDIPGAHLLKCMQPPPPPPKKEASPPPTPSSSRPPSPDSTGLSPRTARKLARALAMEEALVSAPAAAPAAAAKPQAAAPAPMPVAAPPRAVPVAQVAPPIHAPVVRQLPIPRVPVPPVLPPPPKPVLPATLVPAPPVGVAPAVTAPPVGVPAPSPHPSAVAVGADQRFMMPPSTAPLTPAVARVAAAAAVVVREAAEAATREKAAREAAAQEAAAREAAVREAAAREAAIREAAAREAAAREAAAREAAAKETAAREAAAKEAAAKEAAAKEAAAKGAAAKEAAAKEKAAKEKAAKEKAAKEKAAKEEAAKEAAAKEKAAKEKAAKEKAAKEKAAKEKAAAEEEEEESEEEESPVPRTLRKRHTAEPPKSTPRRSHKKKPALKHKLEDRDAKRSHKKMAPPPKKQKTARSSSVSSSSGSEDDEPRKRPGKTPVSRRGRKAPPSSSESEESEEETPAKPASKKGSKKKGRMASPSPSSASSAESEEEPPKKRSHKKKGASTPAKASKTPASKQSHKKKTPKQPTRVTPNRISKVLAAAAAVPESLPTPRSHKKNGATPKPAARKAAVNDKKHKVATPAAKSHKKKQRVAQSPRTHGMVAAAEALDTPLDPVDFVDSLRRGPVGALLRDRMQYAGLDAATGELNSAPERVRLDAHLFSVLDTIKRGPVKRWYMHSLAEADSKDVRADGWDLSAFETLPEYEDAPELFDSGYVPVALDTIRGRVQGQLYHSASGLERDLQRMVLAAKAAYGKDSDVGTTAARIGKLANRAVEAAAPIAAQPLVRDAPVATPATRRRPIITAAVGESRPENPRSRWDCSVCGKEHWLAMLPLGVLPPPPTARIRSPADAVTVSRHATWFCPSCLQDGTHAMGRRVWVWSLEASDWRRGRVESYDTAFSMYRVVYDGGDWEFLALDKHHAAYVSSKPSHPPGL